MKLLTTLAILICISLNIRAQADWSRDVVVTSPRGNPFFLSDQEWRTSVEAGRSHAVFYPVTVTGLLLPYRPMKRFLEADGGSPLRAFVQRAVGAVTSWNSFEDVERWLGLHPFPRTPSQGVFRVPERQVGSDHRMGLTWMDTERGQGFTISCAQCHVGNLFGKPVLGLTNRFPRANRLFTYSLKTVPYISESAFRWATAATEGETAMYADSRFAMKFIAAKEPAQLGLDTSLAQVALSLAKRSQDPWAQRIPGLAPRPDPIAHFVADSKPAVWWNLKYKNRWLSDGSVVSGNPIYTNFIWNEIGRGVDLQKLDHWLRDNDDVIRDLTTAVFATEAPKWTDYFPAESISEERALRGQKVFNQTCSRCHGQYHKIWDQQDALARPWKERLQTAHVSYHVRTPVIDVGTDSGRARGMKSLEALNELEISKRQGIWIEAQKGYVPPPLVGIWARWPYFHNNSAPSLCEVLTASGKRMKTYWAREALDPKRDFDEDCVGYPKTAPAWGTSREFFYDTRREGLRNTGHDEGIFLRNGEEILSAEQKRDLIEFLKTL